MASLEEVTFDLARHALAEQEGVVRDVRVRTGPLLAAAAAVAALMGRPAIEDAAAVQAGFAVLGSLGAIGVVVAGIAVLRPRALAFSVDSGALYEQAWWDRDDPAVYYRRLADSFDQQRRTNQAEVRRVHIAFSVALVALVVQVLGLSVAVAVA